MGLNMLDFQDFLDRKCFNGLKNQYDVHPSVEMDLSLKIEVHDQTIWNSTPEL